MHISRVTEAFSCTPEEFFRWIQLHHFGNIVNDLIVLECKGICAVFALIGDLANSFKKFAHWNLPPENYMFISVLTHFVPLSFSLNSSG